MKTTFLAAAVALLAAPAFAYRPFDGTDGDVAEEGRFELELGPAQYMKSADGRYLAAPATVLNLGFEEDTELVVDFKNFVGLDRAPGQPRMKLLDTDIMIKRIVRRGSLQGESGVSMAVEAGPLLPELNGTNAWGAEVNLITSYRWDALSLHLNTAAAITREHDFDGIVSLIVEGPRQWAVRPVAEIYTEREVNVDHTYSALAGAIWEVSDGLALDAAVRYAAQSQSNQFELRFGLTWGLPIWEEGKKK
jgi:hypothetical protein